MFRQEDQGAGWQRTITFVASATHAKTDAERMVKGAEGSATSNNARKDYVEAQSQAPEFIPLKSSIGNFTVKNERDRTVHVHDRHMRAHGKTDFQV